MTTIIIRSVRILAAVVFVLGCFQAVYSAEPLLVVNGAANESIAPMWVGIEKGFFKKYSLDVRMLQFRSGPLLTATLASGNVQVAWTAQSTALTAAAWGMNLSSIASPINRIARNLMVRKEIKSLEELRGRTFGVQSIGGGFWLYTMILLEHLRLDPEKYQLKMRVIGDTATITQALISNNVDAAVLPYSFSEIAKRAGFHSLADAAEFKGPFQLTGLYALKDFVALHPEIVTRLTQGMIEAVVYIHDPRNSREVTEVLRKNLRFSRAEDAEASYKVLRIIATLDVAPNLEAWSTVQRIVSRLNPKVGQVDLREVLDGKIVRTLEESRFLPEMRRKLTD